MEFPPLKLGDVVYIRWADTKSALGWTYAPAKKRLPGVIISIGYVVKLDDDVLTITTSLGMKGESLDELSIPRGCIDKLEVLPADWSPLVEVRNGLC
jgi:hypothetical protein